MIEHVLTLISLSAGAPGGPGPGGPPLIATIDELEKRRDDGPTFERERLLTEQALAQAPGDYSVLWRAARTYFWASDNGALPRPQRSDLGKKGWDLAERAIKIQPSGVEGHYYAAICMGNYALGLGVVRALSQGLDGKFRERLGRAEQIDARFANGGIYVAWGRFYDKLPWPKRDTKKAADSFRRALTVNPANLRARAYLADSLLSQDHAADAKALLDEVRHATASAYDPPEERRAKAIAAALLPKVLDKLNK